MVRQSRPSVHLRIEEAYIEAREMDGVTREKSEAPSSFRRKTENTHVGRYVETWHKFWRVAREAVLALGGHATPGREQSASAAQISERKVYV